MDVIWNQLRELAASEDGYLRTSQVEAAGISRPVLKKYVDSNQLERVRKGLYILADDMPDEFALLQVQCSKAVYSYGTALFLWGMSDRTPHIVDITVPHGMNLTRLRRDNPDLRCHYVRKDLYELGIVETESPQGSMVRSYDRERCICDMIRAKEHMEMQTFTQALREYFRNQPNIRKLLKYGKQFGIEGKIRTYMEVL